MLALRPNPPPTRAPDLSLYHCRGRSRQVSNTALARQASDERRVSESCASVAAEAIHRRLLVRQQASSAERRPPVVLVAHDVLKTRPPPAESIPVMPIAAPVPVKAACAPPFMRSDSPSPPSSASMSPDYYDSPPSPPRSLEDQVHVAYALDDIHLAKILLLRLKGIEVTSDDDPRIAAVQDEDFDFCFVPNGQLMDDRDEKVMKDMQAREMERMEEVKRLERLRNCERKFEAEKQRMRDERIAVVKRRERAEEERRRALRTAEAQRIAQRTRARADRKIVSYDHLAGKGLSSSDNQKQFVYDYMLPSSSSPRPSLPASPSPPVTRHVFPMPTFDDSTSIPFIDILKSIQGPLFPIALDERMPQTPSLSRSRTKSQGPKKRRRDLQLLEALLLENSDEERKKLKGKQRAAQLPRRTPGCIACSSSISPLPSPTPTTSSPSSSSSISRTSSWLSFRGTPSSASSSTTDLTSLSPMTSPRSSWFASRPTTKSSIPPTTFADSPSPPPLRHSCRPHNRLTPVALADGPLFIDLLIPPPPSSTKTKSQPISYEGERGQRVRSAAKDHAGVLVRRMSKFVELAKGFQNAYVTAALFSVSLSYDSFEDRYCAVGEKDDVGEEDDFSRSRSRSRGRSAGVVTIAVVGAGAGAKVKGRLRPAGSRASVMDVAVFLKPSASSDDGETNSGDSSSCISSSSSTLPPPRYIPLVSPFPFTGEPPRTVLPATLPYELHFKPIPAPIRSPFRFHALSSEMHTMYPSPSQSSSTNNEPDYPCVTTGPSGTFLMPSHPQQVTWRIRSVSNPAYLRLKALHNVVWRRGVKWEGCGRETALGGGRERVVGVAYEGVGRSLLSRSSRAGGGHVHVPSLPPAPLLR